MDLSSHEGEMPIPITSTYMGGHGHHHGQTIIHDPSLTPPTLHHPSNGPPLPPPLPTTTEDHHHNNAQFYNNNSKKGSSAVAVVVKYRECLKNHAASIGGNALDGCGEFMPSGEEGTLEALKCSACNCHRNFHRKEVEGESSSYDYYGHHHHHLLKGRSKFVGQKGVLIAAAGSDIAYGGGGGGGGGYNPNSNSLVLPRGLPSPHHMIMPLQGAAMPQQTSESDEMEGIGGGGGVMSSRVPMVKKRFRTKFTPEQKEKMLGFAEKVGWRLQKQEESVVQQFCQEIGVKRRVLKVWMHNNKHNLAKKTSSLQIE